jgi:hypothetical protein
MNTSQETEYEKYIREFTEHAQDMLGTGKITSEEQLKQFLFKTCYFLSSCDAYCFITGQAPYSWKDIFSLELLKQYECDLSSFVMYMATTAVYLEVFNHLLKTDGYRFLMGDTKTISLQLEPEVSSYVEFKECWKKEAEKYDNKDLIETYTINGSLLSVFQKEETEGLVYVFEHEDPCLAWISEMKFS